MSPAPLGLVQVVRSFQMSQTWEVMLYASFYQTQAPTLRVRTAEGQEGEAQACADPAFRSVVSLTFKTHGILLLFLI